MSPTTHLPLYGDQPGLPCDRLAVVATAEAIVTSGSSCVIEVCADVRRQVEDAPADAVAERVRTAPGQDARLAARRRRDLWADSEAPTLLRHIA